MGYTPPQLEVRTVTGGWKTYPPTTTTGEQFELYPNGTDTRPSIVLDGANNITIDIDSNKVILLKLGATSIGYIALESTGMSFYTYVNRNISLLPNGTGRVKFGAYTAGAATDSTGYIDILDSGGNVRKLMVQA